MQQTNVHVPYNSSVGVLCENCGGDVFNEGMKLRKVSRVLMASDKDQYIPIPAPYCVKCQHVNSEFLPPEVTKE